jgi:large subunit ribosomal protein L9
MEIILKEDIIGLGYKNDIVTVKDGYGRNYLIPQGKGVIASKSARKVLAENMKQQAAKLAAQKAEAEKRAEALKDVAVEISAKVSAGGQLYGSVNTAMVAEELAKKGIEIDRKIITMRDIRKVGEYEAVVHFHRDVEIKVPVQVVAENAPVAVEKKAEEAPVEEADASANDAPAEEDVKESTVTEAESQATAEEAPSAE